jgi:hypothetical protein
MSLLFDQNLSRRLVGQLAAEYPDAEHVEGAGLLGADDLTGLAILGCTRPDGSVKGLGLPALGAAARPAAEGDLAARGEWADSNGRGLVACAAGRRAGIRCRSSLGFVSAAVAPRVSIGEQVDAADGFRAVEKKVHVHDLHATILHLLGFDHTRLTYRHASRDFRLTDVCGEVVNELIA